MEQGIEVLFNRCKFKIFSLKPHALYSSPNFFQVTLHVLNKIMFSSLFIIGKNILTNRYSNNTWVFRCLSSLAPGLFVQKLNLTSNDNTINALYFWLVMIQINQWWLNSQQQRASNVESVSMTRCHHVYWSVLMNMKLINKYKQKGHNSHHLTLCSLMTPYTYDLTLAQVMACCLTAPSHYLNQCWLIISKLR